MMNIDFNAINTAAKLLALGKLVAIPTETVYGLGGDARNSEAIQKIFRIKNRPSTNPLIIHISDISFMEEFARNIPESAYILAKTFWPGPLTLVLPKHASVLPEVTGGQDSVALRIPNHPVALALLKTFGGGIAAPSANRSGAISPTSAAHVAQALGSDVDYILDGGPCSVGIESTIVSLLDEFPVVLRQGHITEEAIFKALETKLQKRTPIQSQIKSPIKSQTIVETPGSSLKHYAPSKPLFLLDSDELKSRLKQSLKENSSCAVLSIFCNQSTILKEMAVLDEQVSQIPWIQLENDPEAYAQGLYAALHTLDASSATCILVEKPPINTAWLAVLDRLQRAAVR